MRKAVALNPSTPSEVVDRLLTDQYRWVREAAAAHLEISAQRIGESLGEADRYLLKGFLANPNCEEETRKKIEELIADESRYPVVFDSYEIKSSDGYGIVEFVAGTVSVDDVAEAITSGEDDWMNAIDHEWYKYEDLWHESGPVDLVDTVVVSSGEEFSISLEEPEDQDEYSAESAARRVSVGGFFSVAQSYESGEWSYEKLELEYEFCCECLNPTSDSNDSYYYEGEDYQDIEGDLVESSTSGTDVSLYVNSPSGVLDCSLDELRDEMDDQGIDFENRVSVKQFLEQKFPAPSQSE